jgi:hypothetical protein
MTLEQTIEAATLAALRRHVQSQLGIVANVESAGLLTRVTGYFYLGSIARDVAAAVKAHQSA